jgi:phosphatidylglycerophosphatase A
VTRPATWLATLGPVGYSPVAPATVASAVVTAAVWFAPVYLPAVPLVDTLGLVAIATPIAVWAAGEAEKDLGHDAGPIVIDELVGQLITLLFAPHRIGVFVAAFCLFRVFDIWKPLGAHQAQSLPGGWGVVADDVIAGATSLLALQGLLLAQTKLGWSIL